MSTRRHVLKDIDPYVCLFEDCNQGDVLFPSVEEWLGHMQWQHTVVYSCQAPGHEEHIYSSEAELEEHIRQIHPGSFTTSQLPHLVKQGALPAADTFAVLALSFNSTDIAGQPVVQCPICHDFPPPLAETGHSIAEVHPDIQNHIIEHLESIALLSLPVEDDADGAGANVKQSSDNSIEAIQDVADLPPVIFDDETTGRYASSQRPDSNYGSDTEIVMPADLELGETWADIFRDVKQPQLPEPEEDPLLLRWQEQIEVSVILPEGVGSNPPPRSHPEEEVHLQGEGLTRKLQDVSPLCGETAVQRLTAGATDVSDSDPPPSAVLGRVVSDVDDDILGYINNRLASTQRPRLSGFPGLQDNIRRKVMEAADGMYVIIPSQAYAHPA